ncbi:M42 family metallopeptidase [Geopsychrobacter electrodiphilus]|uniref:M42 family metallopeptidase n=1 Tax=Geopsychrobacter electrodiphilus TaxID=225196 RepID=UPI000374CA48|nr:M42 family metallopeptidase [Geopsychrobacter electrodiphilus]
MLPDTEFKLLKELVEAPSPSGFETPAQRVIQHYLAPLADQMTSDVMGNLMATLEGRGGPRVMLAGHCDEIGFMAQYVTDEGFIYFGAIGGVDPHLSPGQRINIQTKNGPVKGIIGKKAIHLIETKDRDTVIKLKDQYIDIGCSSREEVEKLVQIGDPITFSVGLERLQNGRLTSRALDDKMGVFIVTQVLAGVKAAGGAEAELICVSTVQEEVGLRGGTTSGYGVNPDLAIVVEVTHATDTPDVEARGIGRVQVGKGPVLSRGANINPVLFNLLVETAAKEQIPLQIIGAPRATGTDANALQLSRGGVATALLGIPLRYMHTPVELLAESDLQAASRLLTAFVLRLEKNQSFLPLCLE